MQTEKSNCFISYSKLGPFTKLATSYMNGQPGLPPWRLALVTIMKFRENLADRQAAEAAE